MIAHTSQEKEAILYGNKTFSYPELKKRIVTFAQLFKHQKIQRVALYSDNIPGAIFACYATWYNKSTLVTIDAMSVASEVSYILNDCKPEIIFVSDKYKDKLREAIALANVNPQVLLIEECDQLPDSEENYQDLKPDPEHNALIIYTSGTTGSPKGVMLSFKNIIANINAVSSPEIPIFNPNQTTMMLLPLHHVLPMVGTIMAPIYSGGTIAIAPSMNAEDIMHTLQQCRVSIIIGVPRLYASIFNGIKRKVDQSTVASLLFKLAQKINSPTFSKLLFKSVHKKLGGHVQFLVCGGAPLDNTVAEGFQTLGFEVLNGFGMTEAAPMISFTRPGDVKIGSPGLVLPGGTMEIRDGEVVYKGDNVMLGYFNRPEETADVVREGWLYTGDLGKIDAQGYLYITGRKKEIIVLSNGKNINPEEIEASITNKIPHIKEIGIFESNDQLSAIIVPEVNALAPESRNDMEKHFKQEILERYNRKVSPYKRVTNIKLYSEELPRTRLGKLKRFQLASLALDNEDKEEKQNTPQHELSREYLLVANFIAAEKKCEVSPGDHLEFDLGLDSLDKVSLIAFIESTFGLYLQPEDLTKYNSLQELCTYIADTHKGITEESVNWSKIIKEKVRLKLPQTWFTGTLFLRITNFFFGLYFRMKRKGANNIPNEPCIIAPNHQSIFDGLFVAGLLNNRFVKNTYFYAKEKHVKSKFLKFIAQRHHIIVMDLNKDLKESIQKMAEALKMKKNLIIFPEGTRSEEGKLREFKKTFAILSKELNVPVVPVSIQGAASALPRGAFFPRPCKKISIEFLCPIYPGIRSSYENIADRVYDAITQHQQGK